MFQNMTIGQRLVLIVAGLTTTMLLVVATIALFGSRETLRQDTRRAFAEYERLVTIELDQRIANTVAAAQSLVTTIAPESETQPDRLRQPVNFSIGEDDDALIHRVNIHRGDTTVVFDIPNPEAATVRLTRVRTDEVPGDAWVFGVLETNQPQWYGPAMPLFPQSTEGNAVSFAVPFANGGEVIDSVLWVDIPVRAIYDTLVESAEATNLTVELSRGYSVLLTSTNEVIAVFGLPDDTAEGSTMPLESSSAARIYEQVAAREVGDALSVVDPVFGQESFAIQTTLSSVDWYLVSFFPETILPTLPKETILQVVLVSLAGVVTLLWFINYYINNNVAEPLSKLSHAAQEIGSGDMRYQIGHRERRDEIGRMALALEDMKRNLAHSYDELNKWGRTLEQRVSERTEELDQARKESDTRADELRAIYDESLSVVTEHRLPPLLDTFTKRILSLLDSSYCSVWLLTDDRQYLKLVASTVADQQAMGVVASVNEGMIGVVTREGRAIRVDDYQSWPQKIALNSISDRHIDRAVCVPLMFSGRAIGAVAAGRKAEKPVYSEDDERKLRLFANMVSPTVRNAQLFVQVNEAVKEAERANQVKTRFLASVTHELRTPLNLIINNMDFMRIGAFGDVNADQISRLDQTIRSAEHLLFLINDLLDVSKIEAGEMELFIQKGDIYPVVEDALDAAKMQLEKDGDKAIRVTIESNIAQDLPQIAMDSRRIRQVLNNLLSNAVKFTQEGTVSLTVKQAGEVIKFAVTDTGIGIPDDEKAKLFQAFERTSRAKELGIEGTGLGLPITRFFVQQHGGTIDVDTTMGKGTTFRFTLPITQPAKSDDKKADDRRIEALLAVNTE